MIKYENTYFLKDSACKGLTHLPLDKMAAISQTKIWYAFVNEKFCILLKLLLKFVPKYTIDNNPALV